MSIGDEPNPSFNVKGSVPLRSADEDPEYDEDAKIAPAVFIVVFTGTPSKMSKRFGNVARGSIIAKPSANLI